MNCQEFMESLPDRPAALEGEPQRHAAECRDCRAFADSRLKLAEGLRALARDWRSVSAPSRIEPKLLTVFRAQTRKPVPHRPLFWAALAWASAAGVTLVLALFLVRGNQPRPRPGSRAGGSRVQLALVQPADAGETEVAGTEDFITLPNAEQIGADEEVNIVRVELPRSSMIAIGYPLSDGEASGQVEADVAIGPDGLARAVRVVDE
jgi:hypothetical protein